MLHTDRFGQKAFVSNIETERECLILSWVYEFISRKVYL